MWKKLWLCGILCLLCLSGCGKQELLQEKLDGSKIDRAVITLAMGNPAYGVESKTITEETELQLLLDAFNGAIIGEKIAEEDTWVAGSGSYLFFSGEEQILRLNVNSNDDKRIWINDAFYEIEYPEGQPTPYEIFSASQAEMILVDAEGIPMAAEKKQ